ERAADRMVVQYRDEILPLISLSECLGTMEGKRDAEAPLQVIVVANGVRSVGLIVDEIIDIIEDRITNVAKSQRSGLLGSAVLGGQITDLVDLPSTVQQEDPHWFETPPTKRESTVLIADPSAFSRGMLRTVLDVAGYRVVE